MQRGSGKSTWGLPMNLRRRNRCILLIIIIIILIIILIQVLQRVPTAIRIKIRIRIRMTGSKGFWAQSAKRVCADVEASHEPLSRVAADVSPWTLCAAASTLSRARLRSRAHAPAAGVAASLEPAPRRILIQTRTRLLIQTLIPGCSNTKGIQKNSNRLDAAPVLRYSNVVRSPGTSAATNTP